MQVFTIKDIENLSGIKAHTLRIWEQRYNLFVPKRKESSHRVYSNEDVKELLQIAFLYQNGWKASKIAELTNDQRVQFVQDSVLNETNFINFVFKLTEAAIDFDEVKFTQLLHEAISLLGFEKCITEVCYPFLTKIGMLWVTNNVIPAQERFATNIIQNKIISETEKLVVTPTDEAGLLLFTPQGEHHELPLLFINYMLKKNNWNTIYLGSNVDVNILNDLANHMNIQGMYTHLLTNFTGYDADDYFEMLSNTFKDVKIIASGTIVQTVTRSYPNVLLLRTDDAINSFIKKQH